MLRIPCQTLSFCITIHATASDRDSASAICKREASNLGPEDRYTNTLLLDHNSLVWLYDVVVLVLDPGYIFGSYKLDHK